jgi:capsular polysaccharide biosynthesis protein
MGKNILITLLVIISIGFLIFSFYTQKVAEKAIIEAHTNIMLAQQNKEEALKQKGIAEAALQEAYNQKKIAEEALAKCK